MEDKKYSWQTFTGAGLLLLLLLVLFLPRMEISGDKYISMAVDANQYAKDQDEKAAKKTNADKRIKKYEKDTKDRKKKEKEFDKKIDKEDQDTLNGFQLGKWALTVGEDDLDFQGVTYVKGKKIKDSGVQNVFRWIGIATYLPAVLAIFGIVFLLILGKGSGVNLVVCGSVAALCSLFTTYFLPGMIWNKISSYVKEFSLIDDQVLVIKGVGKHTISLMMSEFSSWGYLAGIAIDLFLIVAGILFMTALRPKESAIDEDNPWDEMPEMALDGMGSSPYGLQNGDPNFGAPGGGSYGQQNGTPNFGAPGGGSYGQQNGAPNFGAPGGGSYGQQNGDPNFGAPGGGSYGQQNGAPNFGAPGGGSYGQANGLNGGGTPNPDDLSITLGFDGNPPNASLQRQVEQAKQQNPASPKGRLLGVAGQYAGFEMEFDAGEEIVFGRDPKHCKLLFEYSKVSRKHCGVRFDAASGKYQVTDYSSNGTLLSTGQSAKAGSYITADPGTILYLANKHEAIQLM